MTVRGAEVFCNFTIRPALRLATGAQRITEAGPFVDSRTFLSARLQVKF
jgi:hypothetical protein